jgi:hypothetical protein
MHLEIYLLLEYRKIPPVRGPSKTLRPGIQWIPGRRSWGPMDKKTSRLRSSLLSFLFLFFGEGGLGLVHQIGKAGGVLNGNVGQHLAV